MGVMAKCPSCGMESDAIRCPRCNTLKITACSGSCTLCGARCEDGARVSDEIARRESAEKVAGHAVVGERSPGGRRDG